MTLLTTDAECCRISIKMPQPMPRGGKRPNSGAKPKDPSGETRKRVWLFLTKDEAQKVKEFVLWMREQASKSD